MKKILLAVLVLILPIIHAKADTFSDIINEGGNWLEGEYVVKQNGNIRNYQTMNIITRKSDGQFVYCIEPDIYVNEIPITGYNDNYVGISSLTEAQWERVSLLAYYGYGYQDNNYNHLDPKWYVVTQFMIWQSVPTNQDIFFTDTLNGNRITKYEDEIREMDTLLGMHYIKPSFSNKTFNLTLGKEMTIKDQNNVLKDYVVNNNNLVTIIKRNNELKIIANDIGKTSLSIYKANNIYGMPPIIYVDPNTQNVLFRGDVDKVETKINLEITGGNIRIHKTGEELILDNKTYEYKEINLPNVKLQIFAKDNIYVNKNLKYAKDSLIETIKTDENGNAFLDNLLLGNYYLKEINSSNNNILDENIYEFQIKKDNLSAQVNLKNYLPKGSLEFTKKDDNNKPLKDVLINILYENSTIYEGITDSEGKIILNDLPLGKYQIKEIKAPKEYKLSNEIISFEIKNNNEHIKREMINKKIEIIYNIPDTYSYINPALLITYPTILLLLLKRKRSKSKYDLLFISILILIPILYNIPYYKEHYENTTKINDYYNGSHNKYNDYLAILKIPKINLKRGIVTNQNVDKNIIILKGSIMPNNDNSNLILAAHSGNGYNAFFKDLKSLLINDDIYLDYNKKTYHYILSDVYEIDKTGYAPIYRDSSKKTLTLITCKDRSDKQLVFISYLANN